MTNNDGNRPCDSMLHFPEFFLCMTFCWGENWSRILGCEILIRVIAAVTDGHSMTDIDVAKTPTVVVQYSINQERSAQLHQ